MTFGVPQATVLGPLPFLIFNYIHDNIDSQIRFFADGCLVYRIINSPNDCLKLQEDLSFLSDWERRMADLIH